jgi:molybdopterin-guanine dinucleotide biosynthesis adapter protein
MALVKPMIFQVVGYQNSGKTTFITKILKQLKVEGVSVGVIKHHGHGGKPDVYEQKDSARHIENGAIATIVEGNGRLLLQAEKAMWTLQEEIRVMQCFDPDLILIEGYKKENYPKLVIIKKQEDIDRLMGLENIQFIMVWKEELIEDLAKITKIPCFQIDDSSGFQLIINFLQKELL